MYFKYFSKDLFNKKKVFSDTQEIFLVFKRNKILSYQSGKIVHGNVKLECLS